MRRPQPILSGATEDTHLVRWETDGFMHRVLFVCSGNTCRSPMAAGVFNELVKRRRIRNLAAESAGTTAASGMVASPLSVAVARKHGIDLEHHRARPMTEDLAARASLILTMTRQQWYDVTEYAPREKTFALTAFGDSDGEPREIADPAGGSEEEYERVFEQLEKEVKRIFPAVIDWLQREAAPHARGGRTR